MRQEPEPGADEDRIALARERGAQETLVLPGQAVPEPGADRDRPDPRPGCDVARGEEAERPGRHLLHAEHGRVVGGCEPHHLAEESRALRRDGVPVEEVPAPNQHMPKLLRCASCLPTRPRSRPGTTTSWRRPSAARAQTSSCRRRGSGSATLRPQRATAERERWYPLSSRLFKRSRARLPLKAVEHLDVMRSLSLVRTDVLHVQWLALPQADVHLRFRSPSVFTAHDLLPRRTASRVDLWRKLLARFDRVVVHTEHGRKTLAELGVEARVIPHPVYPSAAVRDDDGATILALGVIRPYKGLHDAIEVTRRLPDAQLLVAGDPAMPLDDLRGAERVEWRLGFLPASALERALSEATVAVFPYRAELDQSGALLQALGAGVPAVVYDVAGLGEPVRAFGAGRVVPAGDIDALTAAVDELLSDGQALAARAPARSARARS